MAAEPGTRSVLLPGTRYKFIETFSAKVELSTNCNVPLSQISPLVRSLSNVEGPHCSSTTSTSD